MVLFVVDALSHMYQFGRHTWKFIWKRASRFDDDVRCTFAIRPFHQASPKGTEHQSYCHTVLEEESNHLHLVARREVDLGGTDSHVGRVDFLVHGLDLLGHLLKRQVPSLGTGQACLTGVDSPPRNSKLVLTRFHSFSGPLHSFSVAAESTPSWSLACLVKLRMKGAMCNSRLSMAACPWPVVLSRLNSWPPCANTAFNRFPRFVGSRPQAGAPRGRGPVVHPRSPLQAGKHVTHRMLQ